MEWKRMRVKQEGEVCGKRGDTGEGGREGKGEAGRVNGNRENDDTMIYEANETADEQEGQALLEVRT
jgi:hypothetical protein